MESLLVLGYINLKRKDGSLFRKALGAVLLVMFFFAFMSNPEVMIVTVIIVTGYSGYLLLKKDDLWFKVVGGVLTSLFILSIVYVIYLLLFTNNLNRGY